MVLCTRLLLAAVVAAFMLPEPCLAGPLDPPAGPPASTMKTLAEVEPRTPISSLPFVITQPGSYYLTGNLTGVAGSNGITVNVNDVTIDLGGFRLAGVASSLTGIAASGRSNVHIVNGRISGWGQNGITVGARGRLADLAVSSCGGLGAFASNSSVVTNCMFQGNDVGLSVSSSSIVTGCTSALNLSHGYLFTASVVFSHCTASNNGGSGFSGPGTGSAAVITSCTAIDNALDGFDPHVDSVISHCTARSNGRHGYNLAINTIITDCTATFNTENGIRAGGSGATIRRCTAIANGGGFNGSFAGILIVSSRCRVENNFVTSNGRGIEAQASAGFYVGNTASGNGTNYVMASGNVALVVAATTAGAINGNSGGTSPGTTNPWANFSY